MSEAFESLSVEFLSRAVVRELLPISDEERKWHAGFRAAEGDYLRNKLTGIIGYLQFAASESESRDLEQALEQYQDFKAHYITREQILVDMQARETVKKHPVKMPAIWIGAQQILAEKLLARVKCEIKQPEAEITVNEEEVSWAVAELVRNGVQALGRFYHDKKKGSVKISFEAINKEISISVADDGEGMSEELAEVLSKTPAGMVKKKFSGEVFPGPAFGLSIARTAVDHHGGKILFKTEKSKGSVFTIKIPFEPERDES